MKVIYKNLKDGEIKLQLQGTDDCWHLYNIIEEGDLVSAFTHRTKAQSDDKKREGKGEKEGMYLTIRVTEVAFQNFSDRLRVQGTIEEGPQDIGKHHTLNLKTGSEVKIKKEWKKRHLKRLEEAVKASKQPSVVILSMDDDVATIAVIHQYGVEKIADIYSNRSGKFYEGKDVSEAYYGEILSKIKEFDIPLVIVGPGFARDNFISFAGKGIKNYIVEGTGNAGMAGVKEAINRGIVNRISEESTLSKESRMVEELLEGIARDGAVTYGKDEVKKAIDIGAADRVIILSTMIRENEELLENAEKTGAKVYTISNVHEGGEKLSALGGIAAFLRYKIE
ncbi:MAG: mRNA surveillance protein pelota [Thermoplasmata archaeon]|nr:mRNA surveillance protein pelota [Thermoplasmata archaeon]